MLSKEAFAEKLKSAIEEKGLTQAKLAEALGTSPANISNYVKAKAFPPIDVLVELSNVLEKSLDWLCCKEEASGKDVKLETVGDMVRLLEQLLTWDKVWYQSGHNSFCEILFDEHTQTKEVWKSPAIEFQGGELQRFFDDRDKMKKLVSEGTIDQSFYERWHDDRLSALDRISASTQISTGDRFDEELPF